MNALLLATLFCHSPMSGTNFKISVNGSQARVSHPAVSGISCLSQPPEDGLEYEIVCEKGAELIAVLYDKSGEGALISDNTGIIDTFSCR